MNNCQENQRNMRVRHLIDGLQNVLDALFLPLSRSHPCEP